MKTITIKEPIWKAPRSVGIARHYLIDNDIIEVKISYIRKDGTKPFPDPLYISSDVALKYPIQSRRGEILHIIPISNMETRRWLV